MGFDEGPATQALLRYDNDIDRAVEFLLDNARVGSPTGGNQAGAMSPLKKGRPLKQGRLLNNEGHTGLKKEEGHRVPTVSEKEDMFLREAPSLT